MQIGYFENTFFFPTKSVPVSENKYGADIIQSTKKIAIIMPFIMRQRDRIIQNLQEWKKYPPCSLSNLPILSNVHFKSTRLKENLKC